MGVMALWFLPKPLSHAVGYEPPKYITPKEGSVSASPLWDFIDKWDLLFGCGYHSSITLLYALQGAGLAWFGGFMFLVARDWEHIRVNFKKYREFKNTGMVDLNASRGPDPVMEGLIGVGSR